MRLQKAHKEKLIGTKRVPDTIFCGYDVPQYQDDV